MTSSVGHEIQSYRAELAEAAQKVYDEWDQEDEYCAYGSGGICDDVSDALRDVLVGHGFNTYEGAPEGDDHSWTIAEKDDQYFGVDIAPWVYESGQGYCWVKTPNVRIKPDDVQIWSMSFEDVRDIIEEKHDRNFRILEGSYKEQDVPEYFYLAFPLTNRSIESLLDHRFENCRGVSSNPDIRQVSPDYNTLLRMDGQTTLGMNKLSKIRYSDLDYLVSNDLAALKRIANSESMLGRVFLPEVDLLPSKEGSVNAIIRQAFSEFKAEKKTVQNVQDLYRLVLRILARLPLTSASRSRWESMSVQKFRNDVLLKWISQYRTNFEHEQEWVIKDKTLTIPDRSSILVWLEKPSTRIRTALSALEETGYRITVKRR